jgi:OmpA-OmpF porin, OOP family
MTITKTARRICWLGTCVSVLAATACGGVIRFSDKTALSVEGTPPPKPEEPKRVELKADRIEIKEKIQFAYNDAKILEVSYPLLKDIAQVMNAAPQVKKIEIGGHASTEGGDVLNLELSDKRAKAVMDWLVTDGKVAAARLTAKGYGETKPLVTPDETDAQREMNRRVEFLILEVDTQATAEAAQ